MDIQSAIDEFLQYTESKRGVRNTRLTYGVGLRQFSKFLAEQHHDQLDVDAVSEFAAWLNGNVAQSTKASYLIAVGLFYRWCVGKRLLTLDTAEMEQLRDYLQAATKRTEHLPRLPDADAIDALCQAAYAVETPTGKSEMTTKRLTCERLRNVAIIEALRASGMRVGELVKIKIGDLDHIAHTARVVGKGGKERNVFFDDAAWRALQAYLLTRGALDEAAPVFARHNNMTTRRALALSITTDTVRDVLNDLRTRAGIETPITPHWLRHWFATRILESTHDLALTQDMLGHSSPATTRIYAAVSKQRMKQAHQKAFGGKDETR